MGAGDQQSHLGAAVSPKMSLETEPMSPAGRSADCLERRGEIRLALSEGFGSSGLSPRRPDGDGEPSAAK
jgi:hypothetical protein